MKFSLDEEIQITSPDNESTYPIIFTNRKSIYMDLYGFRLFEATN